MVTCSFHLQHSCKLPESEQLAFLNGPRGEREEVTEDGEEGVKRNDLGPCSLRIRLSAKS